MRENGGISREEFQERIRKCLAEMEKRDLDLMCVYGDAAHPENLIYLADYRPICADMPGYGGYNALFVLARDGKPTLIIDRDWQIEFAAEDTWVEDIVAGVQGDILGAFLDLVAKEKLTRARIEIDPAFMPVPFYKNVLRRLHGAHLEEESRIVSTLRETKSRKEIELITQGLKILGKAHDVAAAMGKEGVREIDIAREIHQVEIEEGAEYTTALFVDAGRRSTIPLASPMSTTYKLRKGDMVLVSIFCVYKNYSAGMDRAWVVGEPSPKQRKLAEIELKTLEKSLSLIKPGVKATEFMKPVYHDLAEPLLKEAGLGDCNINAYVGHGTGVQVYEPPVLWKLDPRVLKPGMVIDMEPGIYSKDPKIGGLRTSEFIEVTETGYEVLYAYPRRIGSLA
jgi:Xaa-Pro aminopeptidase